MRTVDLFPTLAALAGAQAAPPPSQGVSLIPLLNTDSVGKWPVRLSYAERRPRDESSWRNKWEPGEVSAVHDLRRKLIFHSQGRSELFDLKTDRFELNNLIDDEAAADARRWLEEELTALKTTAPRPGAGFRAPEISPELRRELETLGYM